MSAQRAKATPQTSDEFDRRFDDGEDMADHVDWSRGNSARLAAKRVNVDFPVWMVNDLDREAKRIGITRQALIKMWLAERLERKG